jgi:hypothetical protein
VEKMYTLSFVNTIDAFDIGYFIPCVDWLDFPCIRECMKKKHIELYCLIKEITNEHVVNRWKNDEHGNDFVDVLFNIFEKDTNDTYIKLRKINEIKALLLNCDHWN